MGECGGECCCSDITPVLSTTISTILGNSRSSLQLQPEDITAIQEETGFNQNQIERLYSRFSSLDKQDKGYLSREDFLRIPELAINPLGDRIVHAFFFESRSQEEEKVDFKDFVRVLAHFRPIKKNAEKNKLNTRMEKLHFAFRMYDLDGDDKTSQEADVDKDNLISFEEFAQVLERTDVEQKVSI